MNKNLIAALKDMSEVDWHELDLAMQVSKLARDMASKYELDDSVVADRLNISVKEYELFKKAAYNFSMKDLAKLQALSMQLAQEAAKLKVEAQVQFPKYKYSEAPRGEADTNA